MAAKIGVCDTTFARIDLGKVAIETIKENSSGIAVERYTVPGIKDLAVAAKKLIEEFGCDIVVALGMPGPEKIDKQCAHQASTGIIQAQLLTNKHVIEVFVHADEAESGKGLHRLAVKRARKHALNALALLKGKEELSKNAGRGLRQGHKDKEPLIE